VVVAGAVVVVVPIRVVVVVEGATVVVVDAGAVVVVAGREVVVVAPAVVVVVDPGGGHEPPGPQASQQLAMVPTQAVPPCGARQDAAARRMLQCVRPFRSVRQHVARPRRPHVDRAAQETTASWHSLRSRPSCTAAFATCATQLT